MGGIVCWMLCWVPGIVCGTECKAIFVGRRLGLFGHHSAALNFTELAGQLAYERMQSRRC